MRGSSTKKPRALRPSQILPKWSTLQLTETLIDAVEVSKARGLSQDPVEFFRRIVGFEPTSDQKWVRLFVENQFTAGRWCSARSV